MSIFFSHFAFHNTTPHNFPLSNCVYFSLNFQNELIILRVENVNDIFLERLL